MKKLLNIAIFTLMFLVVIGCSSRDSNPIAPPGDDSGVLSGIDSTSVFPLIVSDTDNSGNPLGGVGTMGCFFGSLNLNTLEASLMPLRESSNALNDSLLVDITNFLAVTPCTDCIKLSGVALNESGNPVLTIGVKHPFAAGKKSEPPSPTNRLDLHVFSARGFIISDGVVGGGFKNFEVLEEKIPAWRLLNACGYASEFDDKWDNFLDTEATLHPFILHFDDYAFGNFATGAESGFTNISMPTGNLVMAMGCDYDYKDYVMQFPADAGEVFYFMYSLNVSYGLSSQGKSEWVNPRYRVPQYCQKSATLVGLNEINNHLDDVNETSWADLYIEVLDINHKVAVDEVGDAIDLMDHESSISVISVEVPDICDTKIEITDIEAALQGGSSRNKQDPLRFLARIENKKLAPVGTYTGLIKVLDSYPNDANLNIDGNTIPRVYPWEDPGDFVFTTEEWATYGVFEYTISLGNRAPNCELELASNSILGGATVDAQPGAATNDPDGEIVLYEFDMDYDGEVFNVDASNTDGATVTLGPYANETGLDIDLVVAMRLTDNGEDAQSVICTADLKVEYFSPIIFIDEFDDNSQDWQFDAEEYWGITNGYLSSSGGPGAQAEGQGCYNNSADGGDNFATSPSINVPAMPQGYAIVRLTINHSYDTEIFDFNPFDFTDDCDVWVKPMIGSQFKLLTTDGQLYSTSEATSSGGPSFAGEMGIDPAFGADYIGWDSIFDNPSLAGEIIKIKFRQQADDGIDNCQGGWWIDSIKLEFIP